MLDDAHKMKNLKGSLGGSYDMAIKKINEEMAPEVEKRVRELIKDGYNQKVSVKMLIEEFNTLSTAILTNAYKRTKAIVSEEEKLKKIAEQEEKTNTEENNKVKTTVKNKNSKLKVIKEVTKVIEREVQGEYGLYNIKGSVVTVDEEFAFSNVEDVNCWASAEREDLLKQMEEIKGKINHINSCENEAIEVIETFMNI